MFDGLLYNTQRSLTPVIGIIFTKSPHHMQAARKAAKKLLETERRMEKIRMANAAKEARREEQIAKSKKNAEEKAAAKQAMLEEKERKRLEKLEKQRQGMSAITSFFAKSKKQKDIQKSSSKDSWRKQQTQSIDLQYRINASRSNTNLDRQQLLQQLIVRARKYRPSKLRWAAKNARRTLITNAEGAIVLTQISSPSKVESHKSHRQWYNPRKFLLFAEDTRPPWSGSKPRLPR